MRKNPHGRNLKEEPKKQNLSTVLKFCPKNNISTHTHTQKEKSVIKFITPLPTPPTPSPSYARNCSFFFFFLSVEFVHYTRYITTFSHIKFKHT